MIDLLIVLTAEQPVKVYFMISCLVITYIVRLCICSFLFFYTPTRNIQTWSLTVKFSLVSYLGQLFLFMSNTSFSNTNGYY